MKGFTLLEAMVSTAIVSALIAAAFSVMSVGQGNWFTGDVSAELRQGISQAMDAMSTDLRKAGTVKLSLGSNASATSITFSVPAYNNTTGTTLTASGNITWSTNITYSLVGGSLVRSQGGVTKVIAPYMQSLQFSRNLTTMTIDITAQATDPKGKVLQDSDEAVIKMRN